VTDRASSKKVKLYWWLNPSDIVIDFILKRKISERLLLTENNLHIFQQFLVEHIIFIQATEHEVVRVWIHFASGRGRLFQIRVKREYVQREGLGIFFFERSHIRIIEIFGNHVCLIFVVVELNFRLILLTLTEIISIRTWSQCSINSKMLANGAGITDQTFIWYDLSCYIILQKWFSNFSWALRSTLTAENTITVILRIDVVDDLVFRYDWRKWFTSDRTVANRRQIIGWEIYFLINLGQYWFEVVFLFNSILLGVAFDQLASQLEWKMSLVIF